jgi:hypothetical protein
MSATLPLPLLALTCAASAGRAPEPQEALLEPAAPTAAAATAAAPAVHELFADAAYPQRVLRSPHDSSPATCLAKRGCDSKSIPVATVKSDGLRDLATSFNSLPIGPEEFVHAAMAAQNISPPESLSYPDALVPLLGRRVWRSTKRVVLGSRRPVFVKPLSGRPFTGYVHDVRRWAIDYDPMTWQQERLMRTLPDSTPLWCSEPVSFLSEWRYFVLDGQVIGSAPCDEFGAASTVVPDEAMLARAIELMRATPSAPVGYAITMGVLADGMTVLVSVCDVYRLRSCAPDVAPTDYVRLMWARWRQIVRDSALVTLRDQLQVGLPPLATATSSSPYSTTLVREKAIAS